MTRAKTAIEIDAIAADWVARSDRGLSPEEAQALKAWVAENSRHHGAYMRALAIFANANRARALGRNFDPDTFPPLRTVPEKPPPAPTISRRRLWQGGIAASVLAGVAAGAGFLSASSQTYATERGGMRVVPLADGSTISLNTDTEIQVAFSPRQRRIHLVRGEALFEVAADRKRPFTVEVGPLIIDANAAAFTVRSLAHLPTQVTMRDGQALVTAAGKAPQPLGQHRRAIRSDDQSLQIKTVEVAEIERETVWREGRIAFEGVSLAEAAAEFRRYSDVKIVFADPAISQRKVTGLFNARDPEGFAIAVAASFGLQAEKQGGDIRLRYTL